MDGPPLLEIGSRPYVEVVPAGPVAGSVSAPASKSLTNRLLVIAALAEGRSVLHHPLDSDDTAVMLAGLVALGVPISRLEAAVAVTGSGGHLESSGTVVGAGLSGTTLRYLAAVALVVDGTVVLDGDEPLRRRPIAPLLDALRSLGATVTTTDGRPPLSITGRGIAGGSVVVDAAASSQFATSLLLVAPFASEDLRLEVRGLKELGYVRLTAQVMSRWGASVDEEAPGHYLVRAGSRYVARDEEVEHDASAAAHLFALGVATGGEVTVTNASPSAQPDAGILEVLAAMGAVVRSGSAGISVSRPGELRGVDVDLGAMPDQVPTLAVLGSLARGTTRISNVAIARGHETDRLAAVAAELRRLGAAVEEEPDGLVIRGGARLHGGRVATYRDHRLAMAFAALGAVVPGVEIADPGCVGKTYPDFWRDAARLGARLR